MERGAGNVAAFKERPETHVDDGGTRLQRSKLARELCRLDELCARPRVGDGALRCLAWRSARRQGECYVINGSKTFITNGWHATLVCLAVKNDTAERSSKGISLVMVETRDLHGYRVGKMLEKVHRAHP